jgi:hypothetical protein
MKNTWTWIAVIGLILFGAFLFWGGQKLFTPEKPVIKSDTIIVTKLDTVKYAVKTFVYGKTVVSTDTVIINHHDTSYVAKTPIKSKDTIWVYNQFYSTTNDSIILTDTPDLWFKLKYGISENMLISVKGQYVNKRATQIINNNPVTQQQTTNQLYVGANLSGFKDGFGIGTNILLKTKNDAIWTLGVSYYPYIYKGAIYTIGRNWKIKL